jgi:hypothetical protein
MHMRRYGNRRRRNSLDTFRRLWLIIPLLAVSRACIVRAQANTQNSISQQVQRLNDAMVNAQGQIEESQRQLSEMRRQLAALQAQMTGSQSNNQTLASDSLVAGSHASSNNTAATYAAEIQDIRERQSIQESQIATHEQTKVESESKYPVKITGLLLFNGFVNTNAVDIPATPTVAIPGSGNTGATLRQTVLGFDARGPHLFGAHSYGDLRVDFDGSPQYGGPAGIYAGYYNSGTTLLRLRTAHAGLQWDHTEAYFSFDRPIFSPDSPSSLTAVAVPALAWSGNLWTWNPQLGVTHDLAFVGSSDLRLQAALVDVGDAPLTPVVPSPAVPSLITPAVMPPSTAERSRWPGVEARIAVLGSKTREDGNHLGIGGYFAPHLTTFGKRFDSWAGTLDARLVLPARLEFSGSAYRGLGLGGLGAGGYKDFVYLTDPDTNRVYVRPLDDIGGWAQLKEKFSDRVELNAAFGMDNVFAGQLRRYAIPGGTVYQNLARNRTYTGNVIYSPTAYLLFSLEYRHLESSPVLGSSVGANVIGLAAGYKF